jgi:hypothetical protein
VQNCSATGFAQVPASRHLASLLLILAIIVPAASPQQACGEPGSPIAIEEVAPGASVHFGQIARTTPQNHGDIANLGIIVGSDSVAVVDTGGSVEVGNSYSPR